MEENIAKAHLAIIAVGSLETDDVSRDLQQELLFYTNTHGIVFNLTDQHMLMVGETMPPKIDLDVDLSDDRFLGWAHRAFNSTMDQTVRLCSQTLIREHQRPETSPRTVSSARTAG